MSIFQNPGYLNLARQFMSKGGYGPGYAGRFPDMVGLSRSPAGQGLMQRVLQQLRQSKLGIAEGRRRPTPEGLVGPYPGSYSPPTYRPYHQPPYPSTDGQVKRETTEYFDANQANPNQALSSVGRRP